MRALDQNHADLAADLYNDLYSLFSLGARPEWTVEERDAIQTFGANL